ncbi:MAG: protein phosphatase 2C domain-containing protein, partial [Armatimonadetes bacterium]|nr:protein phosphatase 2C domain-containing protein [Armatimonadota bacterium]
MHADAAFRMGCTHSVCQDYAVALRATAAGGPAILLADGCSSSPDTDVGARLLARATARVLESVATLAPRTLPEAQRSGVERAHRAAADLGLPAGALDATLLVLAAGDGVWWAS